MRTPKLRQIAVCLDGRSGRAPPWDTWVCYVVEDAERYRSYLISWVPPQLIAMADAGTDVNPEGCILWAAVLDAAFTRRLRQAGIVL